MITDTQRWPSWTVTGGAFLLTLLVALLDSLTGAELSFSIFFVGPVGLAAWYGSRRTGLLLAVWSGVLWLAADLNFGPAYTFEVTPYWNALVRLGFFLIIALLFTRLRQTLELVHQQALQDPLTGLPNSRRFLEMVEAEFARMKRYPGPVTLAYLDLDNFKVVNDTKGHAEGDRLLREMARTLRGSVRDTDRMARLGGDEFCLLFPETNEDGAAEGLGKVQKEVLSLAGAEGWPVSLSIGAVTFTGVPPPVEEAIRRADHLMYQVKRAGKNAILQEVVVGAEGAEESGLRSQARRDEQTPP